MNRTNNKNKIKKWKILLTIAVLSGLLTSIITIELPPTKTSFNTIYIDRQSETTNNQYFTYEGLYSQQTAERFTDTVKGLLLSKNLIGTTLEKTGAENTKENRIRFIKSLSVKKTGPQVLEVRLKGKYYNKLDPLLTELGEYVSTINKQSKKNIIIRTVSRPSIIEETTRYPVLNGIVTILLILFIGGIIIEYKGLIKKLK